MRTRTRRWIVVGFFEIVGVTLEGRDRDEFDIGSDGGAVGGIGVLRSQVRRRRVSDYLNLVARVRDRCGIIELDDFSDSNRVRSTLRKRREKLRTR